MLPSLRLNKGAAHVNLRFENLFDEEYAAGHARNVLDNSTTSFLVRSLGVPRTFFRLSYSFGF